MQKPEYAVFSRNLCRFMEKYHLTQDALAEIIGTDRSMVSLYMNGKMLPRMKKIDAMCRAFGCTRSDLLDEGAGSCSTDEAELLAAFRVLDPDDQQVLLNMAVLLSAKEKKTGAAG